MIGIGGVRLPKALAFLERAFGLYSRHHPFEKLSERSRRALDRLKGSPESVRFRMGLARLRDDWDLLEPEATSDVDALRLQLRVLELADDVPELEGLMRQRYAETPMGRLFVTILGQARKDSTRELAFVFDVPRAGCLQVRTRSESGEEREGVTLPSSLKGGVCGTLRYIDAAGYSRVRPYFGDRYDVPGDVEFDWSGKERITLTLR